MAGFAFATTARAQSSQQHSQGASADDTARFLAGMQPSDTSPLIPLTQTPVAKQHAAQFDTAFGNLENTRLSKIRAWSAANLKTPKPVVFYMFGGPDFLYADAFFPNATTYVLSGLEPVGPIPDLMKMPPGTAAQGLRHIQGSLRSVLTVSYFITVDMFRDLNSGPMSGTLPILYVFLARSGKTVHDVSLVHLDEHGTLQQGDGIRPWSPARGVKIIFSEKAGPRKTLYYFSGNLADQHGKKNPILQFCASLGQGDSFVKSASYLLHTPTFSQVRNFILDNSASILQDDTGVPLTYFDTARWQLQGFGRYVTPIFPAYFQPRLSEFFQRTQPPAIDFGVGYRWRPNESNLLRAIKGAGAPEATAATSRDAAPPAVQTVPPIVRAAPPAIQVAPPVVQQAPQRSAEPAQRYIIDVETDNSGKSIYRTGPSPSYREYQQPRRGQQPPDAPPFLFPLIPLAPPLR